MKRNILLFNLFLVFSMALTAQTATDAPACTGTVDYEGHTYNVVKIGNQCWMAENLRVANANSAVYKDEANNENLFGRLYTWYAALGSASETALVDVHVSQDQNAAKYVRGICPQGWKIPTSADFQTLADYAQEIAAIKSSNASHWLATELGTNTTGFDARGAGLYNSATARYENLLTSTYFWTCDGAFNIGADPAGQASSMAVTYFCDNFMNTPGNAQDKKSVRCIRNDATSDCPGFLGNIRIQEHENDLGQVDTITLKVFLNDYSSSENIFYDPTKDLMEANNPNFMVKIVGGSYINDLPATVDFDYGQMVATLPMVSDDPDNQYDLTGKDLIITARFDPLIDGCSEDTWLESDEKIYPPVCPEFVGTPSIEFETEGNDTVAIHFSIGVNNVTADNVSESSSSFEFVSIDNFMMGYIVVELVDDQLIGTLSVNGNEGKQFFYNNYSFANFISEGFQVEARLASPSDVASECRDYREGGYLISARTTYKPGCPVVNFQKVDYEIGTMEQVFYYLNIPFTGDTIKDSQVKASWSVDNYEPTNREPNQNELHVSVNNQYKNITLWLGKSVVNDYVGNNPYPSSDHRLHFSVKIRNASDTDDCYELNGYYPFEQ